MKDQIKERCIYCGGDVYYKGNEQLIKCSLCGHSLVVAKFENELSKMKKAADEGKEAQKALDKAKQEKQAADHRLFRVLSALDRMEDLRSETKENFGDLASAMEDNYVMQQAVRDLLETMQSGMEQGQSAFYKVLQTLTSEQKDAGSRLSMLHDFSERILKSQDDMLAKVQLQSDLVSRLYAMEMDAAKRQELATDLMLQMQQVSADDAKSLKRIEYAAGAILGVQKEESEKIDQLQAAADKTQKTLEAFQSQWKESQLKELRQLYHQAENFQHDWAFAKAADAYRQVVVKGGGDAEVFWRLLLCHYCVTYQKDDEGKMIPIILNPDLTDPDQMSVRRELQEHLHGDLAAHYRGELQKIDSILDKYREVKGQVNYDVFISVKQSRDGHYTMDSDVASDLYDFLTEKKLKVFNSRRTEIPAGQEYEPYIISALMSSKALIVVGTAPENMSAQWVRNEWTRFQWLQRRDISQTGKTERLLFCYLAGGMQPNQIPKALNPDKQAIVDGVKAYSKLIKSLDYMIRERKNTGTGTADQGTGQQKPSFNRISNQMTVWLFQKKYDKVIAKYDELTEAGAFLTHAQLHLLALCAEKKLASIEQLVRSQIILETEPLFKLAQTLCYENEDKERLAVYLEQNAASRSRKAQETKKAQPEKTEEGTAGQPDDALFRKGVEAGMAGDLVGAFAAFSESARMGNVMALVELGDMYQNGYGVVEDLREAEKCYMQAASRGYAPAADALARLRKQPKYYRMTAEDWYQQGVSRTKQGKLGEAFELFRKAAELGSIQAQNHVGVCYRNGKGVLKDDKEAVKWYRKAADQGYAIAQNNLGVCYYNGQGVAKNRTTAANWFQKAAFQGFAPAQYMVGLCFEKGTGKPVNRDEALKWYRLAADQHHAEAVKAVTRLEKVLAAEKEKAAKEQQKQKEKDKAEAPGVLCQKGIEAENKGKYAEAFKLYQKAADAGYANAQNRLGLCYDKGLGVAPNKSKAALWFQKAALQGHGWGQHNYAFFLENGYGISKNVEEAARWYRKSAEQGIPDAQNRLGLCYDNGTGVPQDKAEAAGWYKKAAEAGNSAGQHTYALFLENGIGVQRNLKEAFNWYKKSAEQGFPNGQDKLGFCYYNGIGVAKDHTEAVKWYRKAAEQGFAMGQYHYGLSLENGFGITRDSEEAVKWYHKAAQQGTVIAQNRLGECLEKGIGCVQNKEIAREWYEKAAQQGYEPAQKNLKRLTKKKWFS